MPPTPREIWVEGDGSLTAIGLAALSTRARVCIHGNWTCDKCAWDDGFAEEMVEFFRDVKRPTE